MKVLVTGATSLIGRHTAEALVRRGDDVTVFQRNPSGLDCAEVLGDIRDRDAVERVVEGRDAVVHVAALVAPVGDWADFESVNVDGTASLLAAAMGADVERLVYVSTPSVAHTGVALVGAGCGEADPRRTTGHYATSKAIAEQHVLSQPAALGVVAIRPHLVLGVRDTQLIGRIVDRARAGRLAVVGPGTALVDTTWVTNAADALVAAVDAAPQLSGSAWVVSNGEPRTVRELFERVLAAAKVSTVLRSVPASVAVAGGAAAERIWDRTGRSDDPPMTSFLAEQLSTAHWFDQREVRMALGWEPRVSLAEGFALLAEHFATRE